MEFVPYIKNKVYGLELGHTYTRFGTAPQCMDKVRCFNWSLCYLCVDQDMWFGIVCIYEL